MGLDNFIEYFDNESGCWSKTLPYNIFDLFKDIYILEKCDDNKYINFNGQKYNDTVLLIAKSGLYGNLSSNDCQIYSNKFKNFIETADEYFESNYIDMMEVVEQKCYKSDHLGDEHVVKSWFELLTNKYLASPYEIIQLEQIFTICYENNLRIKASY